MREARRVRGSCRKKTLSPTLSLAGRGGTRSELRDERQFKSNRRLPMRRCALRMDGAPCLFDGVPLPHVSEGLGPAVHGLHGRQERKPALDARCAVDLQELEPG